MSTRDFTVKQTHWPEAKTVLRAIREAVFIIEQQVPRELEWDDQDETALHVLAIDRGGNGIGTGRITDSGQIGRMAVLSDWRNQGIGSALLTQLIALAHTHGKSRLFLNAQQRAIPFYLRHGFHPVGGIFMEAGIPHQRMEQDTPRGDDRREPQ